MGEIRITLATKDYAELAPLACGDVAPAGISLSLIRDTARAMDLAKTDPHVDVGEASFCQYLASIKTGDRAFVGLPVFMPRGFEHRNFYVRRDSSIARLEDLTGKTVGMDRWATTGNLWARAALREQDVDIARMSWVIGPVDRAAGESTDETLPSFATTVSAGKSLREMLARGELDAIVCPKPPAGFAEAGSSIVRLFSDYRLAERIYYLNTRVHPAHHILRIRRPVFERHPWVARSLYEAVTASRGRWLASRRALSDGTPWQQSEIDEASTLFDGDWAAHGVEANGTMLRAFCNEALAQGLISAEVEPSALFSEFADAMRS